MEQLETTEKPTRKIYRDLDIFGATYLGGPLVAGYMIAENFKTFNDSDKARKTWIYAIIIAIILFGGIFLIPEDIKIPGSIIPITYTALAFGLVQSYQKQKIIKHIESGGGVFSWFKSLLIGLIGLTITLFFVFIPIVIYTHFENSAIVTQTYGIAKNEISFDSRTISAVEVDWIADGLIKTGYFEGTGTQYVYVKKMGDIYELSLPIAKEFLDNPKLDADSAEFRKELQSMFPNNKIIIKLVVDSLDNVVKTIE